MDRCALDIEPLPGPGSPGELMSMYRMMIRNDKDKLIRSGVNNYFYCHLILLCDFAIRSFFQCLTCFFDP